MSRSASLWRYLTEAKKMNQASHLVLRQLQRGMKRAKAMKVCLQTRILPQHLQTTTTSTPSLIQIPLHNLHHYVVQHKKREHQILMITQNLKSAAERRGRWHFQWAMNRHLQPCTTDYFKKMASLEASLWRDAMNTEMEAQRKMETYKEVALPPRPSTSPIHYE